MGNRIAIALCAVLGVLGGLAPAAAQQAFPAKPIRWVIDFPAGGISDILARTVAQKLGEAWNTPIVVDNRPGANGIIAGEQLAKAAPDGYTIGLISTPFALNPSLYKSLPYDSRKDFLPLAMIAQTPNVLVVNPQLKVDSVRELIELAKKRPKGLNYASVGNGSSPHLSAEMLKKASAMQATHIPYTGSGPALVDLIAGRADFMFVNLPAALPQIRAGKIEILAVAGERRSAVVPDAPTMIESGLADFISIGWYGVAAPAGMPPELVRRYNAEFDRILKLPDVREKIQSLGAEPRPMNVADFTDFIDRDTQRWSKAVKESGASVSN